MKENSSFSTSCETAAVRVQYWFGKDKDILLPMFDSSKVQEFSKRHKCDLLKAPRIPSQVDHLPLQGYLAKRKRAPIHRVIQKSANGNVGASDLQQAKPLAKQGMCSHMPDAASCKDEDADEASGQFLNRDVYKHRQVTKGSPSKKLSLAIDRYPCSISQKNFNHFNQENTLTSARVVYCRLKEHILVSKKLKSLSKNREASPKRHDVVPIKSSTKEDLSKNPYIQEWGKIREERHFNIGRVIKYLAD